MTPASGHSERGGRGARNALGVLVALLAAVLMVGLYAAERIATSSNDASVNSAISTTALADDLLLEVASQQTGVRAYLVTRQAQMLTAYGRGRAAAQTDLKQIGKFVARRRPSLAPTARTARAQLAALQRSFEREIELVRGGHIVRAEAAGEIAGRQLVDFSHTVEAINDDAGRFIVDARDSQRRTYLVSLVLLIGLGFAALGAGCWLFVRVPRRIQELEDARRRVLDELLRAEELERGRIAAELHDDTIQTMTAALMTVDRLSNAAHAGDADRVAEMLPPTRAMLADAVERARRLTFELHPPLLEANGLGVALTDLIDRAAKDAGLEPDVVVEVDRYSFVVEDLAYRVVREAVANARMHAGASRLEVDVREHRGALHGRIFDDGSGPDLGRGRARHPMGLELGLDALAERVRLADGDVDVRSIPGRGTLVSFWLPVLDSAVERAEAATEAAAGVTS